MAGDAVCILVKSPRPGEVKTRLAPAVGLHGAATLARAFFDDTLSLARELGWARIVVAVSGDPAPLALPGDVDVRSQGEGDLGERMERVLRGALSIGRRAVLLGTDSPGLPATRLEAARTALDTHGAVLGPADDGGFYLIGLDRCEPGLLAGLPWSRPGTLVHAEARLRRSGRAVARTDRWFDVDEPADLARLAALIACGEVRAPATARALASLGFLSGEPA